MKKCCINILIALSIITTLPIKAQKVALVLSGGGSRGAAHIGVIKALEENNIPIDCITGTSIGAIVGGLYAAGYSPQEMEILLTSDKFKQWLSGRFDEKYIFYFTQKPNDASWVTLKFNYDTAWQYILPTNIVSPLMMDYAFMEIFSGAGAVCNENFDSLFIPFRCLAANIEDNEAYIFRNGNLGEAIRASMTYPFYFKPIRVNDKLMFDGGMYNNFPADVAFSDFKPDVIIGSKVAGNYDSPDEDDIFSQIGNMLMAKTDYQIPANKGILITPNVESVNVVDFSKTKNFIDSGYNATIKNIDSIKRLIPRIANIDSVNKRRTVFTKQYPPLLVDVINISGVDNRQFAYINRILRKSQSHLFSRKKKIVPIELEKIKPQYYKLLSEGKIERIYPKLQFNPTTKYYDLKLDVKKEKNILLDFGGNISSRAINQAFVQGQFLHWGKRTYKATANLYFGSFYNSAHVRGNIEFPYKTPLLLELSWTYNYFDFYKNRKVFYEDKQPSYLLINENIISTNLCLPAGNKAKFQIGGNIGNLSDNYYQTNHFGRTDTADRTVFKYMAPELIFEVNSLNKKQYANKGTFFQLKANYIIGNEKTTPGSTSVNKEIYNKQHEWMYIKLHYLTFPLNTTIYKLGFNTENVFSNPAFFHNYTASILNAPAYKPIPELNAFFIPNLRAHTYVSAGLINVFSFNRSWDFRLESYVFQPYQELIQQEDNAAVYGEVFERRYLVNAAGIVFHSPLGPISIMGNYINTGNDPFSVVFNFGYLIFNRKSLH